MTSSHEPRDVIRRLVRWAEHEDPVRAVLWPDLDERVTAYVRSVKDSDHGAASPR